MVSYLGFESILSYLSVFAGVSLALALICTPNEIVRFKSPVFLSLIVGILATALSLHSYAILATVPGLSLAYLESLNLIKFNRWFKLANLSFAFLFVAFSQLAQTNLGVYWRLAFGFYCTFDLLYLATSGFDFKPFRGVLAILLPMTVIFAFIECGEILKIFSSANSTIFSTARFTLFCISFLIFVHGLALQFLKTSTGNLAVQFKHFFAYLAFSIIASGLLNESEAALLAGSQFFTSALLLFSLLAASTAIFNLLNHTANKRFGLRANLEEFLATNRKSYLGLRYGRGQKQI